MSANALRRDNAGAGAGGGDAVVLGAAGWLGLAATPTFAIMALLAAASADGQPDVLCAAQDASWLGGMVPMYALMSAFHAAPWLRLAAGRRAGRKPAPAA